MTLRETDLNIGD